MKRTKRSSIASAAAKRRKSSSAEAYKPYGLSRHIQPVRESVLKFQRTFWSQYFIPSTVSTNNFWQYFSTSLSAMPDVAEITNLFDQYKITGVKYTFVPKFTEFAGSDATTAGTTNRGCGFLSIANDPYSATAAAGTYGSSSYNQFAENASVKVYPGTKPVTVFFKPCINDPQATGTVRRPCPWLQTTNTAESMYGFHAYFHDSNFAGIFNQTWDVMITIYGLARRIK